MDSIFILKPNIYCNDSTVIENLYSLRNGFDLIEHQGPVSVKTQLLGPIHSSMVSRSV